MQPAKEALGVTAMDIAKGLLDMGYMAPTVPSRSSCQSA
ncbi:MAG: hypothetical protein CM15mP18_4560 [Methanobacteriota archaeon]|nr:MAG: hypothetical protein CM15mP18_4560 [Euryarchaeota archaeon]